MGVDGGQEFAQAGFESFHYFGALGVAIAFLLRVVLDVVECAGHGSAGDKGGVALPVEVVIDTHVAVLGR